MVTAFRRVAAILDSHDEPPIGYQKEYGVIYRTLLKKAGDREAPTSEKKDFLSEL